MKTIGELKEKGFIIEDWQIIKYGEGKGRSILSKENLIAIYTFKYKNDRLYVSGGAFGEEEYEVLNDLEVLFKVANDPYVYKIDVKITGLEFYINDPIIS